MSKSKFKRKNIKITKWNSAGNTFVILNDFKTTPNQKKELAVRLCSSLTGIAADGCLYLKKGARGYDWEWDFYNSDGSIAEMCGNAARAADQYCREILKFKKKIINFKTLAGLVRTYQEGKKVFVKIAVENEITEVNKNLFAINTGVPHIVWPVPQLKSAQKNLQTILKLRHLKIKNQKGFNVTLVCLKSKSKAEAVTFERGVENFTLACGTGALAAGAYVQKMTQSKKVQIDMPGGTLFVQSVNSLMILEGETELICKAEMIL